MIQRYLSFTAVAAALAFVAFTSFTPVLAETVPSSDAGAIRRDFKAQGYDFNHPAYSGALGTQNVPGTVTTRSPDVFHNTYTGDCTDERGVFRGPFIETSVGGKPFCIFAPTREMNFPQSSQGITTTSPACTTNSVLFTANPNNTTTITRNSNTSAGSC